MEQGERRTISDRRQHTRNGRRADDFHVNRCICIETQQELLRLKSVVQILVDAVQTLSANHVKR
jgi:hypothetical protein